MRKLLEGIFTSEGFEVRTARNGVEALELVHSFDPQVVTLDVQMPEMDGLSCLGRIMIEAPRPVIMISSLTAQGAEATLEAIELGAFDFVAKPTGAISLEIDRLTPLLIEKVTCAANARIRPTLRLKDRIRHRTGQATAPQRPKRVRPASVAISLPPMPGTSLPGLVLIGSSTGGPAALDIVLPTLPADFPWPLLVAQHMPASFTGPFAKRLDGQCQLRVIEVTRPEPLQAGTIYIGRGDADLVVAARAGGLSAMSVPMQRDYPWHPSVDRLVTSAIECCDPATLIGVLMTGMGNDGATAMARLRQLGGHTIAESEASAVVWGMPGELVKLGGAVLTRPVEEIADALLEEAASHAAH
jgi:two-component system chemotaxis response regulator CheB